VHGWLYVVYLFASYRLWNVMRWRFIDFLLLALGGIVPVLSFVLESIFTRRVRRFLAAHPVGARPAAAAPASTGGHA